MRNRKLDIKHRWADVHICLVLCLCLFWVANSEAKIIEQILVIVNDDIITKSEMDERLGKEKEIMRVVYQLDEPRLSEEIEKRRSEVLETMISELLFLQEAVGKGMKVSDAELQQFISNLKKPYGSAEEFQKALKAEGYTEYTFRKERKRAMLREKLVHQEFGADLEITDDEIRQFYSENKDKFPNRSDAMKLKHIFVKFQTTEANREKACRKAEDLLKRCRDGADFGEMATTFSDHEPTKALGGDMGYFVPGMGQQDPKLEEAASQLAVGEISGLIETPAGYDIIKITDSKDGALKAQRIYTAVKPSVEAEKAAEEKINAALEELKNGANFAELAGRYSDDPLAADKAGDWKEIPVDLMAPEFRRAFASFDVGEVSQPVKTPLGIHIFKIVAKQDLTSDEMEELRRFLSDKRLDEKLREYAEKLREKAYLQPLVES